MGVNIWEGNKAERLIQAINNLPNATQEAADNANEAAANANAIAQQVIAPLFDRDTANDAGTYVIYEGELYYLPNGHTANVTFANTTKTKVKVGDQLKSQKTDINTINGKIGNTALPTTAQTLTGAIAEHETDLAGKVPATRRINGHDLAADVTLDKCDIGLCNVDNTSDADKPISTAQAAAIAAEAAAREAADTQTQDQLTDLKSQISDDEGNIIPSKDLRDAIINSLDAQIRVPFETTFTVETGGVNASTGANLTNAARARTNYTSIRNNACFLLKLDSEEFYIVNLVLYKSTGAGSSAFTRNTKRIDKHTVAVLTEDNEYRFRATFAHNDITQEVTAEDRATIASTLKLYTFTDGSLTIPSVPADGYATGSRITALENDVKQLEGIVTEKTYSLKSGNITPTGMSGDNNKYIRTYSKALYPITEGDSLVLDGDYELENAHIYASNSVSKLANVTTLTITDTQELEIPSEYVGQYLGFTIIKTSMPGQDISAYVSDAELHVKLRNVKGIQEEINELNERVSELENEYGIPDYYFENGYLEDKVTAINTIGLGIGRESVQCFFVTDYHIEGNARHSPALIEYLMEETGIRNFMFGGDAFDSSYSSQVGAYNKICNFLTDFKNVRANGNAFFITGNHEYNNADLGHDSAEISEAVTFNLFNSPVTNKIKCLRTRTNAFFIDDDAAQMRIYGIDCNHAGQIAPDTIKAVLDSFGTVPEGYAVVLFSHAGLGTITTVDDQQIGELTDRMEALMKGAKALNDGAEETITLAVGSTTYTWNVDFTGKARTFICAITGHRHRDAYNIYDGRFPVILTTCDTGAYREDYTTRVAGTITEQAFDVVQIDLATKRIYMTRIGNGSDRVFSFGDGAERITE